MDEAAGTGGGTMTTTRVVVGRWDGGEVVAEWDDQTGAWWAEGPDGPWSSHATRAEAEAVARMGLAELEAEDRAAKARVQAGRLALERAAKARRAAERAADRARAALARAEADLAEAEADLEEAEAAEEEEQARLEAAEASLVVA